MVTDGITSSLPFHTYISISETCTNIIALMVICIYVCICIFHFILLYIFPFSATIVNGNENVLFLFFFSLSLSISLSMSLARSLIVTLEGKIVSFHAPISSRLPVNNLLFFWFGSSPSSSSLVVSLFVSHLGPISIG